MPRVKRGTIHAKRRRNILRKTKGFFHKRKSHLREARQALTKAGQYAFRDRRKKKAEFRQLWNVQLSAALKSEGISYSQFIHLEKVKKVALNRKMLASLAQSHPDLFKKIVAEVKSK